MSSLFVPARREQMRLRMALQGPAGSGKTYTAFTLAKGLSDDGKFAVIDTERRALEYADRFEFSHVSPATASPDELPKMIADAAKYDLGPLVIDSFTHYWSGTGGALDRVDRKPDKRAGWSEYRPVENAMMGAILAYPGHVIVTLRVKTDYVTEQDQRGRNQTRRVGLKPDQRDGVDYEFSVIGAMDTDHTLTITKTTCPDLVDQRIERPGIELVETLAGWLSKGDPAPDVRTYRERALDQNATVDQLRDIHQEAKRRNLLGVVLIDEHGDATTLGNMLVRIARERTTPADQNAGAVTMVDAQRREMFAIFNEIGLSHRNDQIEFMARTLGRDVQSRGSLSVTEATQVIAELRRKRAAGDPA